MNQVLPALGAKKDDMTADFRKTPLDIYTEWHGCTKCELGVRRENLSMQMVIGEGPRRSIMIIGEGPGRDEEEQGKPFVGKSGELLRDILNAYNLMPYCYISNIVACRSCEVRLDDNGQPRMYNRGKGHGKIMYGDTVPTPLQMAACAPRLYEEIYSVDPVVILAVGSPAASFLLGRPVSILKERGAPEHCKIPGATWVPQLTDKKKAWNRKVKGVEVMPIEPNKVRYLTIPTLHPAFVLRKESDSGNDSPWRQLATDIKFTGEIYKKCMHDLHGQDLLMNDVDLDEEIIRKHHGEEADPDR
jgi:DNA polymerase